MSEAALGQPGDPLGTDPLKNLKLHDLSLRGSSETSGTPELSLSAETLGPSTPSDVNFLFRPEDTPEETEAQDEPNTQDRGRGIGASFPRGFHPRRSSQGPTRMPLYSSPIAKNPFMSPLLAPDSMLQSLPPVHIVVSARQGPAKRHGWDAGAPGEESSQERGKVGSMAPRGEVCHQERLAMGERKGFGAAVFFCSLVEHHVTEGQLQGLESQGKGSYSGSWGKEKARQRTGSPVKFILQLPNPLSPSSLCPFVHVFSPTLVSCASSLCFTPTVLQACALDPILDDSVMFARRLRSLCKPVTLRVVEDLPHGFLSLGSLCQETRQAVALCVERIHEILTPPDTAAGV